MGTHSGYCLFALNNIRNTVESVFPLPANPHGFSIFEEIAKIGGIFRYSWNSRSCVCLLIYGRLEKSHAQSSCDAEETEDTLKKS